MQFLLCSFALKNDVTKDKNGKREVGLLIILEEGFYMNNCLYSVPTLVEAKKLILSLRSVLAEGGLNIRQWLRNDSKVVKVLPSDSKSEN